MSQQDDVVVTAPIPEKLDLPETAEQLANRLKREDKQKKYDNYVTKFASRIAQWKESNWRHPEIRDNPPIVWDSQFNDYVWMNRSWRRG